MDLRPRRDFVRYVSFSVVPRGIDTVVTFYEFGDNAALLRKSSHVLPRATAPFINDIAVTENYYIVVEVTFFTHSAVCSVK